MVSQSDPLDTLCNNLRDGSVAALARAISLVESNQRAGTAVHQRLRRHTGNADVIGITGPPGVGKSTLINALVSQLRSEGQRVAVIAVDPSSPLSGGAVLGDRTRMGCHTDDAGVFIRSISARGHLGGLSSGILSVVDLVDAAGWQTVILETVGAGQSEIEIAEVADISVVLNAPGMGDEVQAIKAGILEIADVLVVNKADMPLAGNTERQLRAMLELRRDSEKAVPVVCTTANDGHGIDELRAAIRDQSLAKYKRSSREKRLSRSRRQLAHGLAAYLKDLLMTHERDDLRVLIERLADGNLDADAATRELLLAKPWENAA